MKGGTRGKQQAGQGSRNEAMLGFLANVRSLVYCVQAIVNF